MTSQQWIDRIYESICFAAPEVLKGVLAKALEEAASVDDGPADDNARVFEPGEGDDGPAPPTA